ncbi:MAG TPA: energy transducer TonB [Ignavibacteriaceae bacterium]|nr:energy transducer TonB [Ignavibacteriaceae bacterium]
MTYNSIRHISFSISMIVHIIIFILLLFIKFTMDYPPREYVELSFGKSSQQGSSGAIGTEINKVEENAKAEKNETVDKSKIVKEVELPKAKNTSEENVVKPADKQKEETKAVKTETKENTDSKITTAGQGNKAEGEGSFGYDIDWGGQGQRRIYSYIIPDYPDGVNKEIDIRLRFSILPDGTVGNILPLTKGDTRLENAAINSLRQWRFEALAPGQKQSEQTAVIVFPYRLQ